MEEQIQQNELDQEQQDNNIQQDDEKQSAQQIQTNIVDNNQMNDEEILSSPKAFLPPISKDGPQKLRTLRDQVKYIMDQFNKLDDDTDGYIGIEQIYQLLDQNQIDYQKNEVLEIMKNHNVTQFYSLHDLFTIIWEIDYVKDGILMKNEKNKVGVNPKLIEFLKLLNDFKKKCIQKFKVNEAKMANDKMEEVRKEEINRQINNIKFIQKDELDKLELAQQEQMKNFNEAWDSFMQDSEMNFYKNISNFKQKQNTELEDYKLFIQHELKAVVRNVNEVNDLKKSFELMMKQGKYKEAQKIKIKIDIVQEKETQKITKELEQKILKKVKTFTQQQQGRLVIQDQKIQSEREKQISQRQKDSMRIQLFNKNLKTELQTKQFFEAKKMIDAIKICLQNFNSSINPGLNKMQLQMITSKRSLVQSSNLNSKSQLPVEESKLKFVQKLAQQMAYQSAQEYNEKSNNQFKNKVDNLELIIEENAEQTKKKQDKHRRVVSSVQG